MSWVEVRCERRVWLHGRRQWTWMKKKKKRESWMVEIDELNLPG